MSDSISLPWNNYIDLEVSNNELINQFSINRNLKRLLDNDKAIVNTVIMCAGLSADVAEPAIYANSISWNNAGNLKADKLIDYGYNSNSWWRKYYSGWLEQGGLIEGKNHDTIYNESFRESYTKVFNVTLTPYHTKTLTASIDDNLTARIVSISPAYFGYILTSDSTNLTTDIKCYWHAFGFHI